MKRKQARRAIGLWGCVLAMSAVVNAIAGAGPYSVRDLGALADLSGRTDSRPNDINAEGIVAAANVTNGSYRAFLHAAAATNLGTLGGSEAIASGINDNRQVTGFSTTGAGVRRAFLWTPGATDGVPANPQMKELPTLGGTQSEGYGINNGGQLVGYSQTTGRDHAFRYSNGTMLDIGALLPGALHSYGYAINDSGHVAGTAYNNSFSTSSAFFYNGTTAATIPAFGGDSSALAINDSDSIAGYATIDGYDHAFRYRAGQMKDLGTLGGHYSYALGINNSNTIVGGAFLDESDIVYRAFVSTNDSMVDLNTQLDDSGDGWVLIEARAINDRGQIVGVGTKDGIPHGFLLTPVVALPPAPVITEVSHSGSQILIRFSTVAAATYSVETRSNLVAGAWQLRMTGIAGTGGLVTVTNPMSASWEFCRVKASVP